MEISSDIDVAPTLHEKLGRYRGALSFSATKTGTPVNMSLMSSEVIGRTLTLIEKLKKLSELKEMYRPKNYSWSASKTLLMTAVSNTITKRVLACLNGLELVCSSAHWR